MTKLFALTALLNLFFSLAQSQDTIYLKRQNRMTKGGERAVVTDRPPQAVYAELYGRGIIFSINYDRRFNSKPDGLGFSLGTGVVSASGSTFVSIPVSVNYLLGKNGHYFETGVGATYANVNLIGLGDGSSGSASVLATLTFGYRSQPVNGGFNFRVGLNYIGGNGFFTPWPYIGFGYNF